MSGIEVTDPVPSWSTGSEVLLDVTDFLRRLSSSSEGIRNTLTHDDWLTPPPPDGSFFIHGDPHPTNVIFDDERRPTALVDFELATVGPEDWNIASLMYTWVPLEPVELTCWRNVQDFSPMQRLYAVLERWRPSMPVSTFIEHVTNFIHWRKQIFEALATVGNPAARSFVDAPTYEIRHTYAVKFLTEALEAKGIL